MFGLLEKSLEGKINSILERNARVEADKAWETSLTRRGIIIAFTYLAVLYFLFLISAPNPFLVALVPAGAYVLQQFSFPFIRKWWAEKIYRK